MREEGAPPTNMEFLPKAAELVADEGSSMGAAVVTVAPLRLLPAPLVPVEAEWLEGAAETTGHLLAVAITTSPRVRGPVAGMVRIGPSITQPGPGTEVKRAVRVQSMRKSLREGEKEVRRLAVRVVQVTVVPQTRKTH